MEARFIGDDKDIILEGHHKLFWPFARRIGARSSGECFPGRGAWSACTALPTIPTRTLWRLFLVPTIFIRDPCMWLKRKKLGSDDLREGRRGRALVQALETEEGDKKEVLPLV